MPLNRLCRAYSKLQPGLQVFKDPNPQLTKIFDKELGKTKCNTYFQLEINFFHGFRFHFSLSLA